MTDPDYDHIMIIIGYEKSTTNAISALYWNDFTSNQTTRVDVTHLFQTRTTCTNTTQPCCLPLNYNYGIRIQGNTEDDPSTTNLSQSLKVNSWYEPDYSSEDQVSPKPAPVSLVGTLTIRGVIQGTRYSILRYDRMDFSATSTASSKEYCFTASTNGTFTFVVPDTLLSNQSYFFRTKMNNSCINSTQV